LHGPYDRGLMKRGIVARRLISEGEDPFRMLAAVVWPGRDWAEDVLRARLMACPECLGAVAGCSECGSTGFVSARQRLPMNEAAIAAA
jgi:hypothetical protein